MYRKGAEEPSLINRYQLLAGAEAFTHELDAALSGCRRSLYAQFMTYEGDGSGHAFSEMLAAKAAAGVDVRLLVDGYTDVVLSDAYPFLVHRRRATSRERAHTYAVFDALRARGVGIKRTAPPGFLNRFFPYRDHKKMIVLDERIAFVGGINISDHNYAWHDFMVKIEGPLVHDLARDFCSTWDGATIALAAPPDGDFVLNQCTGRWRYQHAGAHPPCRAHAVDQSPCLLEPLRTGNPCGRRAGCARDDHSPAYSNKLVYRLWARNAPPPGPPNIAIYGYAGSGGMTHTKLLIVDDLWAVSAPVI
jgi:cardiolipin synthase